MRLPGATRPPTQHRPRPNPLSPSTEGAIETLCSLAQGPEATIHAVDDREVEAGCCSAEVGSPFQNPREPPVRDPRATARGRPRYGAGCSPGLAQSPADKKVQV